MRELINIAQETTFTLGVNYSTIKITLTYPDRQEEIIAKGIMVIPHWAEIIPAKFRTQIIKKSKSDIEADDIYKDLLNENYYLNIKDYSEQEIKIACDFLTRKWTNEIWNTLVGKDLNYSISLKDNIILRHVLEKNSELFRNENEFQKFCASSKLTLHNFIVPANFSYLTMKLKETELRLQMEQFFARRFLFTESLVQKLKLRIHDYEKHNVLSTDKKAELISWMDQITEGNRIFNQYKDIQRLYDMPKQGIKIKNSDNVNIFNGDIEKSEININNKKTINDEKVKSSFDKREKIIMLIIAAIGLIVTIVINWDSIVSHLL